MPRKSTSTRSRSRGSSRSRSPSKKSTKKRESPSRPSRSDDGKAASETLSKDDHFEFEFGGPIGAAIVVLSLPFVVIFLHRICPPPECDHQAQAQSSGQCAKNATAATTCHTESRAQYAAENCVDKCIRGLDFSRILQADLFDGLSNLISWEACLLYAGWFLLLVVLERILPCPVAKGVPLPDGSGRRLGYNINAFRSLMVAVAVVAVALGVYPDDTLKGLAYLHDQTEELAVAAILWSTLLSVCLYIASRRRGALLAAGGDSGWAMYDFWMGRELNPRIGTFDWKYFCELRPGLIGWLLLNMGMVAKERLVKGHSSPSMLLLAMFQGLYVVDATYNEESILTTMDIVTDGFGFMLAFGDLAWVPFTYSLPGRFLATRDAWAAEWDWLLLPIAALGLAGFYMFRAANAEKDAFRRNPQGEASRHLESMPTQRGTRLLVSGWWGAARKINYTADWLFGLSWSLCAGFGSPVPYFYPIYFAILLIHRAMRDDRACALKYGGDWAEYKRRVPYLFVPGLV